MERITDGQCRILMQFAAYKLGKPWADKSGTVYSGNPHNEPIKVGTLWTRTGDHNVAYIGAWHLDGAYGGLTVHEMMNDGGGVTCPISHGHLPRRELYNRLHAFIDGITAKESIA